jgi:hypothetical protein
VSVGDAYYRCVDNPLFDGRDNRYRPPFKVVRYEVQSETEKTCLIRRTIDTSELSVASKGCPATKRITKGAQRQWASSEIEEAIKHWMYRKRVQRWYAYEQFKKTEARLARAEQLTGMNRPEFYWCIEGIDDDEIRRIG